jgi:hypothetical protein
MMQAQQKKLEGKIDAEQSEQTREALKRLDEQQQTAKTDEEKAVIVAQKEQLKNRPRPFTPDTTVGLKMMNDPVYRRFMWAEYATGIPLNVALLISGIGLMRMKPWGRSLSNATAALKLVRALVLMMVTVLVVAPNMTKFLGKTFDDMGRQIAAQQPARGQQTKDVMGIRTRVTGAILTGVYVVTYLLAMIYPVVLLVLLNRPGARAALLGKAVAEGDPSA